MTWRYDDLNELQTKLLENNVIDLVGEVDEQMEWYAREALLRLEARGSPEVEVRITSRGGNAGVGLHISDALRLYKGKKRGVVTRFAHSSAVFILLACDKREATAHATFVVHYAKFDLGVIDVPLINAIERVQFLFGQITAMQTLMFDLLASRTGQSLESIRALAAKDHQIFSSAALEYGLIDKII